MKYLGVVLAALLFGASAGQAAQVRFRIALRGTVQTAQGVTTLTDQSLVSMSGNALVLMLDVDAGVVAIEEWNSSLTTEIDRDPVLSGTQALMENFRMATITGRGSQFMANLEMVDVDWNHDGVEDTDGDLQIIGRLIYNRDGALMRVTGQLIGVLNDPINGAGGGVAKVFRGTLRTIGPAF